MSTDYDSPPHQEPFRRNKIQNKRVYGKKGKRAIAGTSQNAESLGRNRKGERESSSETDGAITTALPRRRMNQMNVANNRVKGKGRTKESAWEESETGTTSSSGSIVASHSIKVRPLSQLPFPRALVSHAGLLR
jgi:hypothetical protein